MTNFYTDGGNTETKLHVVGPYMPCTMKQLATIHLVEHSVPYELGTIIQRNQRWLDETPPELVVTAIGQELYEGLRQIEGKAYMVGREYNEPQGVFCCERIQRVKCALLDSDAIIDLVYRVNAQHRASAAFLCSENTARHVKRMKDSDGRFLFSDSLAAGVPARLIGYPLHVDPDAPDGQLMFGDFREGYRIDARPWITILRDPFSQKPHVLFHATMMTGGEVANDVALKILDFTDAE